MFKKYEGIHHVQQVNQLTGVSLKYLEPNKIHYPLNM